ncbi:LOG family protein [archaeon]|nr:LOG family protein [archaeon]MBT6183054.1 LOG family protein [archaeon]MBT6606366.1 LOG family protein [archaeon]MBT7251465.1 LOG family protein [archaeon]MBT7660739.1 LOG family protein [archaeon]
MRKERKRKDFRVTIFGSARIKKDDKYYKQTSNLAEMLGKRGIDIVTGGGPGLMQAASEGHRIGRKKSGKKSHSIGLLIKLPTEQKASKFLDIKKQFSRFSNRLDNFMNLSNAFVVATGGIGTILEFFYALQLMQVKQTCNVPIILIGNMWPELISWLEKYPVKNGRMKKSDLNPIIAVKTCNEAIKIIDNSYEKFLTGNENFCLNYKKYKVN